MDVNKLLKEDYQKWKNNPYIFQKEQGEFKGTPLESSPKIPTALRSICSAWDYPTKRLSFTGKTPMR